MKAMVAPRKASSETNRPAAAPAVSGVGIRVSVEASGKDCGMSDQATVVIILRFRLPSEELSPRGPPRNPAPLVDRQKLVGRYVPNLLFAPAGPFHLDGRSVVFAKPESQGQVALRTVARSAANGVPLLAPGALHAHHGPDTVAIRLGPGQSHAQQVVAVAAVIAEQVSRSVVGGNQKIQVAVMVKIRIGGAAGDDGPVKAAPICALTFSNL